ncbi:metal ABC transporter solute-binding protein, Zn/Mn family [Salinigranum salinum]|uniref:metal ABC transporter solute-binding protein, Zn/Mn family n=1 Tax=Salinigranum salinum TaxID=1364937 RepID=UPI001260C33E|nr:zinc ABC transporter substrate-binding protein [Salinigranum salinum]
MRLTRRRLLTATAGAASIGTVAGCTGAASSSQSTEPDAPVARASFFVFGDVVDAVAGDVASAELLVPVGQHGHGWEPGPSVREAIDDADLFVHGMEGFQPWADRILSDLAADGSAVTTVDVSAGLDLLAAGGGDHHDGAEEDHQEDADYHDGAEEGHQEDADHHDQTGEDHQEDADHHDQTGEDHQEDADHHDEDHRHAGSTDPHFWMDPIRVGEAAENVRRGLAAVDPANADAYATNADAFRRDLDALDDRIRSVVAGGSTDVVLVAGHDSFGYLGDRYGVQVVSLTSTSPDDRPTPRDIERAREIVVEHGLRYVCADPLESQRAAEQLVAETDAEAVLPLTAMPGLTEEWASKGWGYVDIVENVNLPTLERVLDG